MFNHHTHAELSFLTIIHVDPAKETLTHAYDYDDDECRVAGQENYQINQADKRYHSSWSKLYPTICWLDCQYPIHTLVFNTVRMLHYCKLTCTY